MRIAIFRNFAHEIDVKTYNSQEIGLAKAFTNSGIDVDIYMYSEKNNNEKIYHNKNTNNEIILHKRRTPKFFSNAIFYKELLKIKDLKKYHLIITSEYNQIMTFLLSLIYKEKVKIYHGPYKDNEKSYAQFIYDYIFLPIIKRNTSCVYVKSKLAKEYLETKGFTNVKNVGVGLNPDNFRDYQYVPLDNRKSNLKKILYIGKIEKRRNYKFLIDIFEELNNRTPSVLTIIGTGSPDDLLELNRYIEVKGLREDIVHYENMKQSDLINFYETSDVFLLPTSYEIFGMVILECLHFNLPIVTTHNGGSELLIEHGYKGIVTDLDVDKWVEVIEYISKNEQLVVEEMRNINTKVLEKYNWDNISYSFME